LKELNKKLKRPPTSNDDRNLTMAAIRFFGSWNEAKKKAKLRLFYGRYQRWSRELVLKRLKELSRELKRSPTSRDDPNLTMAAVRFFGSWNKAKKKAKLEIYRIGRQKWSKELVLKRLKELSRERKRSPTSRDDHNLKMAAVRLFGSWNKAKKKAKLELCKPGRKPFFGGKK